MEKRFVDINAIAEYLGMKKYTIYCWVNQRKIPYVKMGRLLRFDTRMINKWVEDNSVYNSD